MKLPIGELFHRRVAKEEIEVESLHKFERLSTKLADYKLHLK